jgi:hypothetical protein
MIINKLIQAAVIVVIIPAFVVITCFVSPRVELSLGLSFSNNCNEANTEILYAITPTTPPMAIHICNE